MPPTSPVADPAEPARSGLRWSNWNLLLLVPLLMLVTPLINRDEPRLLGFPFFYWVQFLFVPVGVACVAVVYIKTRHFDRADGADRAGGTGGGSGATDGDDAARRGGGR